MFYQFGSTDHYGHFRVCKPRHRTALAYTHYSTVVDCRLIIPCCVYIPFFGNIHFVFAIGALNMIWIRIWDYASRHPSDQWNSFQRISRWQIASASSVSLPVKNFAYHLQSYTLRQTGIDIWSSQIDYQWHLRVIFGFRHYQWSQTTSLPSTSMSKPAVAGSILLRSTYIYAMLQGE